MAKKKKVKLNANESKKILPIIREFNKVAGAISGLISKRVESKERKISVMVSKIKKPGAHNGNIHVKSVSFNKSFIKQQRKKRKKGQSSDYDEGFSQRRGFVI